MSILANDVLTWASMRTLIEPVVNTTLGTTVAAPGVVTITPPTMASIYNGAQMIVGSGGTQEVITASGVTAFSFQATFVYAHASNEPLVGATFPTGQPSDVLFTQAEMLGYLSDALLDFMLKAWPIYNIVAATFNSGVRSYQAPSDAIRIERISRVDYAVLGTTVSAPGVHTITPPSMASISNGSNLLVGIVGTNFEVVVASNCTATTFQATFVHTHAASDPLYPAAIFRLWDVSVSDLDRLNPRWQADRGKPVKYYEDQLNVGQYAVDPLPSSSWTSNIWYSQRSPVGLALNSTLFVPDPLVYISYYGMLARVFRKDGEMRDPMREQYCQRRYDVGVEIVVRFLEGMQAGVSPGPVQQQARA